MIMIIRIDVISTDTKHYCRFLKQFYKQECYKIKSYSW